MDEGPARLIPGAPLRPLHGDEHLAPAGAPIPNATILNFWRWVAGDLRDNTNRGNFAEWLVGVLLGINMGVRIGWEPVDFEENGVRIEVKSTAYIQGWGQRKLSVPRFGALVKQRFNAELGVFEQGSQLNADWYVFALETCMHGPDYNPLDLSQWRFYLAPRDNLTHLTARQTLSLQKVQSLAQWTMTAEELAAEGPHVMRLTPEPGR